MTVWVSVPICSECGDLMDENDDGDYECINCDKISYFDDLK